MFKLRSLFMSADGGGQGGGGGSGAGGGGQGAGGQGGGGSSALGAGAAQTLDWMPESLRVMKADGTLDIEPSARKLATSYGDLTKRMKDVGLPPESHDKYDFSGVDAAAKPLVDELLKDKGMQEFVKAAHAQGLTNKQLSFIVGHYAKVAPDLAAGGATLTEEECTAELRKTWASDQDYNKHVNLAWLAANTFAQQAGMKFEDLEKAGLGDNPTFVRLMAKIGAELPEDAIPNAQGGFGGDGKNFDEQIAEIEAELDKLDQHDPKRPKLLERKSQMFARKYSSKPAPAFKGAA